MKELSYEELAVLHKKELQSKLAVIAAIKPYGDLIEFKRKTTEYENIHVLGEAPTMLDILKTTSGQQIEGLNDTQELVINWQCR